MYFDYFQLILSFLIQHYTLSKPKSSLHSFSSMSHTLCPNFSSLFSAPIKMSVATTSTEPTPRRKGSPINLLGNPKMPKLETVSIDSVKRNFVIGQRACVINDLFIKHFLDRLSRSMCVPQRHRALFEFTLWKHSFLFGVLVSA